jgi:uncharacterized protein (UPF0276 family)
VGFTLQPDDAFLELAGEVAARADYLEIAPETTWAERSGVLVPNDFHARFLAAGAATGKPFVAHGVGMSMATGDDADAARRARWLERMREDQHAFRYRWWTDHLGASSVAGEALTLPMPMPMDEETLAIVRRRLDEMADVVPDVGVENTVVHFTLGEALDEPAFLARAVAGPRRHLLLDLHNVHTMAIDHGFDPREWLARCDLESVIEIHVSGGSESDPAWLPSGRTMRLDGHDGAVPEEVWALLDETLPRCPSLRGVTLERMEGTISTRAEARVLGAELERIRVAIARAA